MTQWKRNLPGWRQSIIVIWMTTPTTYSTIHLQRVWVGLLKKTFYYFTSFQLLQKDFPRYNWSKFTSSPPATMRLKEIENWPWRLSLAWLEAPWVFSRDFLSSGSLISWLFSSHLINWLIYSFCSWASPSSAGLRFSSTSSRVSCLWGWTDTDQRGIEEQI